MTVSFGRHRLRIRLTRTTAPVQDWEATAPVGMDDHELARLHRRGALDHDHGRWEALELLYGGSFWP